MESDLPLHHRTACCLLAAIVLGHVSSKLLAFFAVRPPAGNAHEGGKGSTAQHEAAAPAAAAASGDDDIREANGGVLVAAPSAATGAAASHSAEEQVVPPKPRWYAADSFKQSLKLGADPKLLAAAQGGVRFTTAQEDAGEDWDLYAPPRHLGVVASFDAEAGFGDIEPLDPTVGRQADKTTLFFHRSAVHLETARQRLCLPARLEVSFDAE